MDGDGKSDGGLYLWHRDRLTVGGGTPDASLADDLNDHLAFARIGVVAVMLTAPQPSQG